MKKITIAFAIIIIAVTCCKKEKQEGQKCVWNVIFNNQVTYEWLDKPTYDQTKKIEDSCSCTINVNEVCFNCNTTVTTTGGIDVKCK